MGWGDAIAGIAKVFTDLFAWKTGGRTEDANQLRDEAQHWREEYTKAIRGGDPAHASFSLEQLRRVRDQARSQSKP